MTDLINSLKTLASSSSLNKSPEQHNHSGRRNTIGVPPSHLPMRDICNESGFAQWRDAMRMVARLPGGLPTEFRLRLWENLADRWLVQNAITWEKIQAKISQSNSRDHEIAEQIDKDLHRTGCTGFSFQKQAVLKEVLLAFSRWNGEVGYCQGLNMIGATLLQMTAGDDKLTLKILIFVIEGVLPQGYFSQGLRGLAVDMAVFREILKNRKPSLHAHLSQLQKRDDSPPLTDVFTMHWFLTLFIHCLPNASVLRIWDLLLLEGSEVLLRTALVLWAAIETRIISVQTTDEFYSVMGVITREMIEFGLLEPNSLVKCIVSLGSFPYPGLQELRQRHRNPENLQKSFFLPKKELDALKRHYAAIRHRQRNTTIIMKNMDVPSRGKSKTFITHQSNKRQGGASPKPKVRRSNSGKSSNAPSLPVARHQVTLTWDKAPSKAKKLRKRRPSASSMTTSSSSTELCDSGSDNDEKQSPKVTTYTLKPKPPDIKITPCPAHSLSFEETEAELNHLLIENPNSGSRIDTSDSQHFLDELLRIDQLRKSYGERNGDDNFYENLSQKICQLQFQNLTLLTQFTANENSDGRKIVTGVSPLPSPISPILSFHEHFHPFPGSETSNIESNSQVFEDSPMNTETEIHIPEFGSCNDEEEVPKMEETETTQTRDEITNIIRENLKILSRLKLKATENHSEDSSSSSSESSGIESPIQTHVHKRRHFNPFPTSRPPRTKTTKFGLYK